MSQYGFYIDSANCSGCKTCQIACKDKNNLPMGVLWRRVYEIAGGEWIQNENNAWDNKVVAYNLSMSCNHCELPSCISACPTGAIVKNEKGIVLIDPDFCVGCKYCSWACPYGAPKFNPDTSIMSKCNYCIDYVDAGQAPSCVDACPMRALDFGLLSDLQDKYGSNRACFPLKKTDELLPSIVIRNHPDEKQADSLLAKIANQEEVKHA